MSQIVYILENPYMPDLIKIGFTEKKLEQRLSSLYNSSVPVPFECYFAVEVEDARDIERLLHQAYGDLRVNNSREFFRVSPENARILLERFGKEVIVGEITSDTIDRMDIMPQADGSFMIEGSSMIREINQRLEWNLPTEGPKTLSGLILENVQTIPETNIGVIVGDYRIETVLIKDNVIKIAKIEKIDTLDEESEVEE